jgi:hypothetical protein
MPFRWGKRSFRLAQLGSRPCASCAQVAWAYVTFRFVDLLYFIGLGWERQYIVACTACGTSELIPTNAAETRLGGNQMPLRYRFGWAWLLIPAVAAIH